MQAYYNTILTSQGNGLVPFSNATINVYLNGTTTPAAIFSNNGVTAQSNPFQASVLGVVTFYAADGRYDIKISGVGFATVTVSDVLLEDPLNATSYIINGGSIDGTPIGATVKSTGGFTTIAATGQISSTLVTGTAPLVIASATLVPNLYVARAALADSSTLNANLTGPITSAGNATSVAAQTGTGTTFVMNTSPTLITPNIGAATGNSLLVGTNVFGKQVEVNVNTNASVGFAVTNSNAGTSAGAGVTFSNGAVNGSVNVNGTGSVYKGYGAGSLTLYNVDVDTVVALDSAGASSVGAFRVSVVKASAAFEALRVSSSQISLNHPVVCASSLSVATTLVVSGATGVGPGSGTGASAVPGVYFTGDATTGFKYRSGAFDAVNSGTTSATIYSGGILFSNLAGIGWSSGYPDVAGSGDINLVRDSVGVLALKNAANAQEFRVYGTTVGPKYLSLKHDGTNGIVGANSGAVLFQTSATTYGQLGSAGVWSLGGAAGAESLRVTPTASAVNYIEIVGAATGNGPQIRSSGADAVINPTYISKGAGSAHIFLTGAASLQQFQIADTASAVNVHQFTGSTTGNAISWAAAGTDANIPIRVATKGTGAFLINTNLSLNYNGTNALVVPLSGQLAFNTAAIATTATAGFHCTVSGAGAPTGVPASIPSGQIPTYYDSTNNRIYFYNGSWRSVAVA